MEVSDHHPCKEEQMSDGCSEDTQEPKAKASALAEEWEEYSMPRTSNRCDDFTMEVTERDRCPRAYSRSCWAPQALHDWQEVIEIQLMATHIKTKNWPSISTPLHQGWDRRGGFFGFMAKDPPPRRYTGLGHLCKAFLHSSPCKVRVKRDAASPVRSGLSGTPASKCTTTPGRPLHRELKSNLDK